jgi:hypothetical protein
MEHEDNQAEDQENDQPDNQLEEFIQREKNGFMPKAF